MKVFFVFGCLLKSKSVKVEDFAIVINITERVNTTFTMSKNILQLKLTKTIKCCYIANIANTSALQ